MEENLNQNIVPPTEPVLATSTPPVNQPPFGSWWKVGGLVVGALLVAGGLFFAGYQYSQKQTTSVSQLIPTSVVVVTPTPNPIANWKTYTNNQHQFSLKYPAEWFTGVSDDGTILFDKNPINQTTVVEPDQVVVTVEVVIDPKLIDLYIKNPAGSVENRVVGSISFDYITIKTEGGKPPKQLMFAQTQHNAKLYRLGLSDGSSRNIFDQILSTFRFDSLP